MNLHPLTRLPEGEYRTDYQIGLDNGYALCFAEQATLIEALKAAEVALIDLGACCDEDCQSPQCNGALSKVRAALLRVSS